jgi:hypothetical protein
MNETYNTAELQKYFTVIGFGFGFCAVKCKLTDEKGSFDFKKDNEGKRIYYNYVKA